MLEAQHCTRKTLPSWSSQPNRTTETTQINNKHRILYPVAKCYKEEQSREKVQGALGVGRCSLGGLSEEVQLSRDLNEVLALGVLISMPGALQSHPDPQRNGVPADHSGTPGTGTLTPQGQCGHLLCLSASNMARGWAAPVWS